MGDGTRAALARTDSALLRAVEAEARRRERIRIGDLIRAEMLRHADADHRTVSGRIRAGVQAALDAVPLPDYDDGGPWTELAGSVCGHVDGVDVGTYLERDDAGDPDIMPIRLRVTDGSDETVAHAYLTPAEAAEVADLLAHACRRHAEWVAATAPVQNPGDGDGGG